MCVSRVRSSPVKSYPQTSQISFSRVSAMLRFRTRKNSSSYSLGERSTRLPSTVSLRAVKSTHSPPCRNTSGCTGPAALDVRLRMAAMRIISSRGEKGLTT